MLYRPLSLVARTLYAVLRELALAIGATENMGETPGAIDTKTVRGNSYLYFQYRYLDGGTKQTYLGPDDTSTQNLAVRLADRSHDRKDDLLRLNELRAAFVGAGGLVTEHAPLQHLA